MAIMDATASRHVNGELYYEHRGEARGLRARQYVYGIGSYHYNWHPALEVLVVVTGGMELCADGRVERCEPGDVMVINSNDGHATLATQPHTTVLLLHIDAGYLASFTQDGSVPPFQLPLRREHSRPARLRATAYAAGTNDARQRPPRTRR